MPLFTFFRGFLLVISQVSALVPPIQPQATAVKSNCPAPGVSAFTAWENGILCRPLVSSPIL